jgi:hypothetical protein
VIYSGLGLAKELLRLRKSVPILTIFRWRRALPPFLWRLLNCLVSVEYWRDSEREELCR